MSKLVSYTIRTLSIILSCILAVMLGIYCVKEWPLYDWALTGNTNFGISLLVMINEFLDLLIVGMTVFAIFAVPRMAFELTRRKYNV